MHIIKRMLSDNSGDVNMEHMIIIAIAFLAGAILIGAVWTSVSQNFPDGMSSSINEFLN